MHPTSGRPVFHLATTVSIPLFEIPVFDVALAEFARQVGASSSKQIVFVLDRAGWHTSVKLRVPDHVHLRFLPPYSPELQPAEHLAADECGPGQPAFRHHRGPGRCAVRPLCCPPAPAHAHPIHDVVPLGRCSPGGPSAFTSVGDLDGLEMIPAGTSTSLRDKCAMGMAIGLLWLGFWSLLLCFAVVQSIVAYRRYQGIESGTKVPITEILKARRWQASVLPIAGVVLVAVATAEAPIRRFVMTPAFFEGTERGPRPPP